MSAEPAKDGDSSKGSNATIGVSALVIVLAVVSVICRFYTRLFTRVGLGWDDWLIMTATVLALVSGGSLIYCNITDPKGQWFVHSLDREYAATPEETIHLKLSFLTTILYFSTTAMLRLGILKMYHRIFSVDRRFRYHLIVAATLVIAAWIGFTVATVTNCFPLDLNRMNGLDGSGHCFNYNVFWMASGGCEVVLDVMILTLPIGATIKLQLSLRRRLTVIGIFLLGGFVVVTGILKTVLGYSPNSRVPQLLKTEIWTTVHVGMSIVCANLPILRPLVRRVTTSSWFTRVSVLTNELSTSLGRSRSSGALRINSSDSLHVTNRTEDKQPSTVALEEGGEEPTTFNDDKNITMKLARMPDSQRLIHHQRPRQDDV